MTKPNPADEIKKTTEAQLTRIRAALKDRKVSKVAEATGLHRNTVRNIMKGVNGIPEMGTIEKLANYLFN